MSSKIVNYKIIEGSLPDGLQMSSTGDITGVLPSLDTVKNLSSSENWYYSVNNSWHPWGHQWRFKVRAWVVDSPNINIEQWFCIRVYNNWSWERDKLKAEIQKANEQEFIDVKKNTVDVSNKNDNAPISNPVITIPTSLCPCEDENNQEKNEVLNFLKWYNDIKIDASKENNPFIQKFIDNFKKTDYYDKMINKSGLADEKLSKEEKEKKSVESLIAYYNSKLKNGRGEEDTDYIMLNLKDKENQKLPITIFALSGSSLFLKM